MTNPLPNEQAGQRANAWKRRAAVITIWAGVVIAWLWHSRSTGLGVTESLQQLVDHIRHKWWAIPAYVAAYAARPLLLVPASLLTIAGGIVFGPIVGIAVVVVASNLSALIAYAVGRALRGGPGSDPGDQSDPGDPGNIGNTGDTTSLAARWAERLRQRSFITVLVMRLAFLPYDLVNYACGMLGIRVGAFLAATAIGSLPGTVSFVLAGASVDRLDTGLDGFDWKVFAASAALFVVSIAGSSILHRRETAARP